MDCDCNCGVRKISAIVEVKDKDFGRKDYMLYMNANRSSQAVLGEYRSSLR